MTSNADELEESVAQKNRPWSGEVVGVLLPIELAPDRGSVGLSKAASDLISNQVVDEDQCQNDGMINPVVLERPDLRKYCNRNASKCENNGVQSVLVPYNQWSFHDSNRQDMEYQR